MKSIVIIGVIVLIGFVGIVSIMGIHQPETEKIAVKETAKIATHKITEEEANIITHQIMSDIFKEARYKTMYP